MNNRNHRLALAVIAFGIELARLAEKVIDFLSVTSNYARSYAVKMDIALRTQTGLLGVRTYSRVH